MVEEFDKYDLEECLAAECEYRAPVAHVVLHIIGWNDLEHNRIEDEVDFRTDQF